MAMFAISRMLCAVDLSDPSKRALRRAQSLARQYGASLRVLYVQDDDVPSPSGAPVIPADTAAVRRAEAEEALQWFVAGALDAEVPTALEVRDGPVARTILAAADDCHADVIVVGVHGRGGVERFMAGSVTSKLLQRATRRVLVVPPGDPADAVATIRVVVCGTDFSPAATDAVDYARFVATTSGAALILTHAVEWPFGDTSGDDAVAALRRSLETDAASRLRALVVEGGPPTDVVVGRGAPWHAITTLARDRRAALIVVGHSGRGAVNAALLGSTPERVVRHAHCPVLVVPRT